MVCRQSDSLLLDGFNQSTWVGEGDLSQTADMTLGWQHM
jgi:hypothetical protein